MGDTKAGKPGVFRRGGILASRGRVMQAMVFVAVSVATIVFAFAQLGLVGLGEPNEGMTYAVVQLVPVAIAALLFGPLGGALLGLIAGAALLDDDLDLHPRELIELVRRDVTRFSEGAEQADDITMLALEFGVPPRSRPRSPFPPTIASFRM